MFYGSLWTQNSMVAFFFKFDLRKGQMQVKLGQIRSNFKIQKILIKTYLICYDLSQNSKKCLLFLCTKIRITKHCISKIWRHHLYLFFFTIAQAKTKILPWNLACFLFACISITHILVFCITENFGFYRQLFERSWNFEFWGSNSENIKNPR